MRMSKRLNESSIELCARLDTAASLLSGLPSRLRSNPSSTLPIASLLITCGNVPLYGVSPAPMHSGLGVNNTGPPESPPHALTINRPRRSFFMGYPRGGLEHDARRTVNEQCEDSSGRDGRHAAVCSSGAV